MNRKSAAKAAMGDHCGVIWCTVIGVFRLPQALGSSHGPSAPIERLYPEG